MNNKLSKESDLFWAAIMFYTRIPVPKSAHHSQEILNRSRKYFPVIGLLIASIAIMVLLVSNILFSLPLAVALSMAATVLVTGAFHEDGFADSCDGLGGGWSKEQVLTIMKDSRVGTYATVGLLFILGIKFLVLLEIVQTSQLFGFIVASASGHCLSRQLSSELIEHYDYVQDLDISKVKPITERKLAPLDRYASWAVTALALLPLAYFSVVACLMAVLISITLAIVFMRYCKRRIGGYTGDTLGATQQLTEVSIYLAIAATL